MAFRRPMGFIESEDSPSWSDPRPGVERDPPRDSLATREHLFSSNSPPAIVAASREVNERRDGRGGFGPTRIERRPRTRPLCGAIT